MIDLGRHGVIETRPDVPPVEAPRPYGHPVLDSAGRTVTDFRPADHAWHHGLSLAIAVVRVEGESGLTSFWGGPTYVRDDGYVDLGNQGSQVVESESGGDLGLSWRDRGGRVLMTETRRHRVIELDETSWALEISSTWRAQHDLRFGSPTTEGRPDAGYGGLFLRADARFTGAAVLLDGCALAESEAMGEPGTWSALDTGDEGAVALVVDPSSALPRGPWFIRSEPVPLLCAAPFFHDEWSLAAGAEASWRWWLVSTVTNDRGRALAEHVDRLVSRAP